MDKGKHHPYNLYVASDIESPFSFTDFRIQMLLAKRKSVPIVPPVRPLILNTTPLDLLGRLQFFNDDATYKLLLKSEAEGPGPTGFAHPL